MKKKLALISLLLIVGCTQPIPMEGKYIRMMIEECNNQNLRYRLQTSFSGKITGVTCRVSKDGLHDNLKSEWQERGKDGG